MSLPWLDLSGNFYDDFKFSFLNRTSTLNEVDADNNQNELRHSRL